MSKIVFFCIPAHGHTNPTLGVVRELMFILRLNFSRALRLFPINMPL